MSLCVCVCTCIISRSVPISTLGWIVSGGMGDRRVRSEYFPNGEGIWWECQKTMAWPILGLNLQSEWASFPRIDFALPLSGCVNQILKISNQAIFFPMHFKITGLDCIPLVFYLDLDFLCCNIILSNNWALLMEQPKTANYPLHCLWLRMSWKNNYSFCIILYHTYSRQASWLMFVLSNPSPFVSSVLLVYQFLCRQSTCLMMWVS